MINKNSKFATIVAVFFEIIVITTIITNILSGQWSNFGFSLLIIACLLLPFIITRIANLKSISLPPSFQLVTLVFLFFAQYLGEITKFYITLWWWDLFVHTIFGCYTVILSFHIIKTIFKNQQEVTINRFIFFLVIFAFCFSIALGTIWEMFEFIGDELFKSTMIKGGLKDTATDLLANILSASITSIICYFNNIKNKRNGN